MTPRDKLAEAIAALDYARPTLEQWAAFKCGDGEIDEAVSDAAATVEAEIAGLARFHMECA